MFERYTDRARRVLFFARYEASQDGRASIESEHVLLGLVREAHSPAAQLLAEKSLTRDRVRSVLDQRSLSNAREVGALEIPFSVDVRKALVAAGEEATNLGHHYVGCEHLVLGLLHQPDSVASTLMHESGLTLDLSRVRLLEIIATPRESRSSHTGADAQAGLVVVLSLATVQAELREEFARLLMQNARESVATEQGCLRFDVSQVREAPNSFVVHEVYADAWAFTTHQLSSHCLAYEAVASWAVTDKKVLRCDARHVLTGPTRYNRPS